MQSDVMSLEAVSWLFAVECMVFSASFSGNDGFYWKTGS